MKALFFGNCQVAAIQQTINFQCDQKLITCFNTDINEDDFKHEIESSDIIITQYIHEAYRNLTYLNTSFVMTHRQKNTSIIFFDSLYFDAYFIDLKSISHTE